jgi:hypothetical protein
MSVISTPQYPVISWLHEPNDAGAPSGCYLLGELSGSVIVPPKRVYISRPLSGGAYGFRVGTLAGTAAKMLEDALDLLFSVAPGDTTNPLVPFGGLGTYGLNASCGYVFDTTGRFPKITTTVTGIPGGATLEITFPVVNDCYVFGTIIEDEAYPLTPLIPGTTNRFILPSSPAGCWSPNCLTVWEDRTAQQTTMVSQSSFNPGIRRVITWAKERQIVQLSVPTVNVERIWSYRRADAGFQVDFPTVPPAIATNLYEYMMRAAREDKLMKVAWNASTSEDFRILDPESITDPASTLTDVSGRGRIYSVAFPMEAV